MVTKLNADGARVSPFANQDSHDKPYETEGAHQDHAYMLERQKLWAAGSEKSISGPPETSHTSDMFQKSKGEQSAQDMESSTLSEQSESKGAGQFSDDRLPRDPDLALMQMSKEELCEIIEGARKEARLAAQLAEQYRLHIEELEVEISRLENQRPTPSQAYALPTTPSDDGEDDVYNPDRLFGRWNAKENEERCKAWSLEDPTEDIFQAFLAEAQAVLAWDAHWTGDGGWARGMAHYAGEEKISVVVQILEDVLEIRDPKSDAYVSPDQQRLLSRILCTRGDIDVVRARGKAPPKHLYKQALDSLPKELDSDDHKLVFRELFDFVEAIQVAEPGWLGLYPRIIELGRGSCRRRASQLAHI
ncbi:hypothetical protein BOTBODRAFT_297145 [Botryobasidium botryosum FD-172 SS1]|uniref:Uncharacterized protein n=1 Tax=Botryobasidium botryosum (strain FD-172 SS1) TaxID=930990 RepID=A0A067MKM0_BOTB1|nr:hypothetical protein BOTBODRAFT_297145 [Botryobasidium botryosum FD-172 SS1]